MINKIKIKNKVQLGFNHNKLFSFSLVNLRVRSDFVQTTITSNAYIKCYHNQNLNYAIPSV